MTIPSDKTLPNRGVGKSIAGAFVLIFWDAALSGSFLMSFLVCPIWFLVSILKNLIQRPGWKIALFRIAIPVATLGLVLANNDYQYKMAESNAAQIVTACEQFHAATGKYPQTLDELVPQYLPSVPPAKYCLLFGEFRYWKDSPMLVWCVVPPYGRAIYNFEERRWNYLD